MRGNVTVLGQKIMLTNLCKEIVIPGYPKTSASLNRLMPKYKFSRAKWYEAKFNWKDRNQIHVWCSEQFGPRPKVSDAWSRWFDNYHDKMFFRDEKDYQWFILRWGA